MAKRIYHHIITAMKDGPPNWDYRRIAHLFLPRPSVLQTDLLAYILSLSRRCGFEMALGEKGSAGTLLPSIVLSRALMRAAQRVAHQLPRAHGITFQNRQDLAREAVGWMRVLGGLLLPQNVAYDVLGTTSREARSS